MIKHLEAVDEFSTGVAAACEFKADQTSIPTFEVGIRAALHFACHGSWENDLCDLRVIYQMPCDCCRIGAMLPHAQRHRFESLDKHERIERRHRSTDITQQRDPSLDYVGNGAERLDRLRPNCAVIARVRLIEHGKSIGVLLPIEVATVDDDSADRSTVPANVFRC